MFRLEIRTLITEKEKIFQYSYRPFDVRFINYDLLKGTKA
jgi:hypothetical protein